MSFWRDGVFDAERARLWYSLEAMANAIRDRNRCEVSLECGGRCRFEAGHDDEHLCDGDTDGPGTCPA